MRHVMDVSCKGVMNMTLWGLGPSMSMSMWSEIGLGWMLYYRRDGPGFNHFPKGLHLHSSIGSGISGRSGEEIYEHMPYERTPQ